MVIDTKINLFNTRLFISLLPMGPYLLVDWQFKKKKLLMSLFIIYRIKHVLILCSYGDMPAHNFLWRECQRTSGSVIARIAVIPMVQVFRNNHGIS